MADSSQTTDKAEVVDDSKNKNVPYTVSESEKRTETTHIFSQSLASALQTSPQISHRLPKPVTFATPGKCGYIG